MRKSLPLLQRYVSLRKKLLGVEELHMYDLYVPMVAEADRHYTFEEAKDIVKTGLAPMGEEYLGLLQEGFDNRWIDVYENEVKRSGAYSWGVYGCHPYVLLNFHGTLNDVFTLAHELGHAGHFRACNSAQSIFDTDVSSYFVEAPSTMNELLMAHYLLQSNDDKRFRRWVLSCQISNTYYHNFVTHLMEAAYQREVYRIIDNGGSVQADTLSSIMKKTLQDFWGDDVEICDGAKLTWMRQPHYYMGLYSYTYSAGLTVATQVCKRIEKEGQTAVDDWKKVLAAGSTLTPVELAALAKVDITTDAPLLDTIETIGDMIDEICRLTDELEEEDK